MPTHLSLLPLLLLGACFCAQSQTLHRCSGQGGTTAYRSSACLPGERLIAVREMEAERAPPPPTQDAEPAAAGKGGPPRVARPRPAGRAYMARRSTHAHTRSRRSTVDPCSREKRARDEFQRRRGIKVTMAELSRWSHRIYDACK